MSELSAIRGALRRSLDSSNVPIIAPSAVAPVTVTSGASTSYARGSWVQASSSGRLTAHAITRADIKILQVGDWELDIGTGAAGSEVLLGTLAFSPDQSGVGCVYPIIPGLFLPVNERVALRVGANSTSPQSVDVKLGAVPRPF